MSLLSDKFREIFNNRNKNNANIMDIINTEIGKYPCIYPDAYRVCYLPLPYYNEMRKREKEITSQLLKTNLAIQEILFEADSLKKIHIKNMINYLKEINIEELYKEIRKFVDRFISFRIPIYKGIDLFEYNSKEYIKREEGIYHIKYTIKYNGTYYLDYSVDFKNKYYFPTVDNMKFDCGKRLYDDQINLLKISPYIREVFRKLDKGEL